jgi:bifunctional DNA-binding transcriptional regulator/antitoxin component of YhaV-PrlF toxin-antitoxin module
MKILEIDGSGRLYIPSDVRRRVPWRRFKIEVKRDRIVLIPVELAVDKYYGFVAPAKFTSPEEIHKVVKVETEKFFRKDIR